MTFTNHGDKEVVPLSDSVANGDDDGDRNSLDLESGSLPRVVIVSNPLTRVTCRCSQKLAVLKKKLHLLRDRRVVLVVAISGVFGFVAVISNEVSTSDLLVM